jgi:hypothetical protein
MRLEIRSRFPCDGRAVAVLKISVGPRSAQNNLQTHINAAGNSF